MQRVADMSKVVFHYCIMKKQGPCLAYGDVPAATFSGREEPTSFMRLLDGYDVISFDIFDTLLLRGDLRPEQIFKKIEDDFHWQGFAETRVASEQHARTKNKEMTGSEEISLPQIYQEMEQRIPVSIQAAMQIEFEMEKQVCRANPAFLNVVWELYQDGKTVVCTSDMYLSQQQLAILLEQAGYPPFDAVLASCDESVSKYGGELFDRLQEKYAGRTIVHVGDHLYSDYIQARRHGIMSVYYHA